MERNDYIHLKTSVGMPLLGYGFGCQIRILTEFPAVPLCLRVLSLAPQARLPQSLLHGVELASPILKVRSLFET